MPRYRAFVAAALTFAFPWVLSAQSRDAEVQRDLAFARGLASELSFIDLAEQVMRDLEEGELDRDQKEQLALTRCDVFALGAKTELRAEKREGNYDKAIIAYQDFLSDYEFGEHAEAAERAYVDIANAYGVHMEGLLDDAVGEEAARIRGRIETVLGDAISRTGDLIDRMQANDEMTDLERRELYTVMFNRGQLLVTMGKSSEEGTFFFDKAESLLGDLALKAGERSPHGMYSYWLMGQLFSAKGEYSDAADYLEFVVTTAIPRDPEEWARYKTDLDRTSLQSAWGVMELALGPLVDALSAQGTVSSTRESALYSLYFYNRYQNEGFNLGPRGYLSMLSAARALVASGGFIGGAPGTYQWFATAEEREEAGFRRARQQQSVHGIALTMADIVNRDNRKNTLQIRAQRLVAEIIDRPGVRVEPKVLFEAAEGEYSAKEYEAAAAGYRRVLRALETESENERKEYAPKVHFGLGKCYRATKRPLEAAMTFREGLVRYEGDPQFDKDNAEAFLDMANQLKARYGSDSEIADLKREAESWVLRKVQEEAGDIKYRLALESWSAKDFSKARTEFQNVPNSAENFEKAKAYTGACSYRLKELDRARTELAGYLNEYINDPTNTLTEDYMIVRRKEAVAMSTYYLGRLEYDTKNYARAAELTSGYSLTFPEQDSYGPASHFIAVRALLELGDFAGARTEYDTMLEKFPTSRTTAAASVRIYKVLEARRAEAVKAGNAETATPLLQQMAELLAAANKSSSKPVYGNMRNEAKHWLELGEYEKAEAALRRLRGAYDRGKFNDVKDVDKTMERVITPELAHVLLEQQKTSEALELLKPLIPDPNDETATKPDRDAVMDFNRAVTGWVTGPAGVFEEVPGVGDAAAMELAANWWHKIAGSTEKWTCEWYGHKFNHAYALYRWSHLDSSKKASAKQILKLLVDEFGPEMERVTTEGCDGDDVTRSRLAQLWALVR